MELPFTLQRLTPEALEVLRFLHKRRAAADAIEIEQAPNSQSAWSDAPSAVWSITA